MHTTSIVNSNPTRRRLEALAKGLDWKLPEQAPEGFFERVAPPEAVPAVRDAAELWVAWRCVELVEGMRNRGEDPCGRLCIGPSALAVPSPLPAFAQYANDLANFVTFGRSSLTPYEARTLSLGIGYRPATRRSTTGLSAGDRVSFSATGVGLYAQGRAIMVDQHTLLLADRGRLLVTRLRPFEPSNPVKATLLVSALLDGR